MAPCSTGGWTEKEAPGTGMAVQSKYSNTSAYPKLRTSHHVLFCLSSVP